MTERSAVDWSHMYPAIDERRRALGLERAASQPIAEPQLEERENIASPVAAQEPPALVPVVSRWSRVQMLFATFIAVLFGYRRPL